MVIDSFNKQYFFLSNFYPVPITYRDMNFYSVEAAYQAAKCKTLEESRKFTGLSAKDAKALGKTVELREDWEQVKISVMHDLLRIKFRPDTELADMLLQTGNAILVEGNWWLDVYWGVCNGVGENHLGRLLMSIRDELSHEVPPQ